MIQENDLGCTTNDEVIRQFVSLEGQRVIDAGCGDMAFTRQLVDLGASVLAIDPDPVQAKLHRDADPLSNVEFVETGADKLPADACTVDGIFFSYSLHHIPKDIYSLVFGEVLRVLKPDGFLYVIEPTECPLNDVMKLFHNEDADRAAAWRALEQLAISAFHSAQVVTYHSYRQFDSYEDFARHFSSRSFNTIYTEADVRRPEVEEAFERLGKPDYRFKSPKQVMVLQGVKLSSKSNRFGLAAG
jgi:ubiquinone/menaquinone biosynthesis C-methylase UbiE